MSRGNPIPIKYYVNERGCHICTSHSLKKGYPQKCVGINSKWKVVKVVKYLWKQVNGPVPDGLGLLHSCDTPACINIEHIRLGTGADNVADRVARGRSRSGTLIGEKHGMSKLTEENVRFIRNNIFPYGNKLSGGELGRMFGVYRATISKIICGKLWKCIK